ncbi:MAG: magnesium transporter [Methanobacteriaceae archaeon]|jgi:magnesium transporter|nr:magnesium transporter [Methanobacteriaceae archaeon]
MEYPQERTIEELITSKIPTAIPEQTIGEVQEYLEINGPEFDNMDYTYVLDGDTLKGVLSIKEILSLDHSLKVSKVMRTNPITSTIENTSEEMVYLALSHGLKAVPVVKDDNKFLGIISHDEILKIFNREVESDIFQFGGIFHKVGEEYTSINSSTYHMIRSRLPWLIIGIIGGIGAASLIGMFEDLLSSFIALASFIPVMVYMSDAAGTQSEALIIRSMALDSKMSMKNYIIREIKVATVIALVSGLLAGMMAFITRNNPLLGAIIFLSMFFSIIASIIIATIAPLIFKKINFDPAVATGPLATIVSDIATLAIYLGVALLLMGLM